MRHIGPNEGKFESEQLDVNRVDLMGLAEQLVRFDEITMKKQSSGLETACYIMDQSYSRETIETIKKAVFVLNRVKDIKEAIKALNDVMDKQ